MAARQRRHLDRQLRRQIVALAAEGRSYREILERVDTSMGSITVALRDWGGLGRPTPTWTPATGRLSLAERIEIRVGLELGRSVRAIAIELGRVTSTVSREVKANGGRDHYRPLAAHHRAEHRARRPKPTKLARHPALCARVRRDLEALWSPQQIAHRLATEVGQHGLRVSHETIYKSLYVQGRGELRRELAACLRTGRTRRRPQGRLERRGRIPDMVNISQRPPTAADRAVPGHWEGDLIIGRAGRSAIGTLVERSTRYVMLLHLPAGRGAAEVRRAMTEAIQTLPASLRRSVTWDQGTEMAEHAAFSVDTGVEVYFCDPHSPWQRGSNENTNGLLRQYFPKSTDLSGHGPEVLAAVADSLNSRPRQTLGWMTPSEKLAELVALTA
jgi:IS30 family transposase